MALYAIDDTTAEQLLTGALSPEDAPPAFVGVARLFEVASGPATPAETAAEASVVAAAMAALTVPPAGGPLPSPRKPRVRKVLTAKVAALVATLALGASAAAAATTGNLPSTAQTAVSDALAHVDISVPKPNRHANANATTHGKAGHNSQTPGHGPSVNADFGLCTAFMAGPSDQANPQAGDNSHSGKDDSTAFTALMLQAADAGKGTTAFCQGVIAAHDAATGTVTSEPPTTAVDHGKSGEDHGQSGQDHGQSGQDHGKPSDTGKPSSTPTTNPAAGTHSGGSGH